MTVTRLAAVLIAVASLAVGVWTFPSAFEPGRSESDGPLTGLLAGARIDRQNWAPNETGGTVTPDRGSISVDANGTGLLLLSRTLPVFPQTCYRLEAVAAAHGPGLVVKVLDERARVTMTTLAVPIGDAIRRSGLELWSGERRRLTLGLSSDRPTRAVVGSVTLRRVDDERCGRG